MIRFILLLVLTSQMAFAVGKKEIQNCIKQNEKQYGIPRTLLSALIKHESSYQEKAINPVGPGNAVTSFGLGQITIPTAKTFCDIKTKRELLRHDKNIKCTAKILKHHIKEYGDVHAALAAYRAGTPCRYNKSKKRIRICTVADKKYIRDVLQNKLGYNG